MCDLLLLYEHTATNLRRTLHDRKHIWKNLYVKVTLHSSLVALANFPSLPFGRSVDYAQHRSLVVPTTLTYVRSLRLDLFVSLTMFATLTLRFASLSPHSS